jgi:hypothetical protein
LRPLTTLEALLCTLAAVLGAIVSWRFIEQPFRRRGKPPLTGPLQSKRFFIPSIGWAGQFALALTAMLIACGSFFQESKGAAWRFPIEARNILDRVGTSFADCDHKNTGRTEFTECVFGDQPADLVLWGDSHAQHYMPLVAKIYGGGTAYFTPGCPPLQNAHLIEKSGKPFFANCQTNNHYVLERISALKPKIVVMASRWTQIEDFPYGRESRPALYLVDETAETTREASRKTFAHAIEQTVSMLSAAGIKVVLMGQVPEMLFPPSRCLAPFLPPLWRDCGSVTRQEAERRQNYVNATLKTVARNNRGVFFFSPFSELCDNAYCYAAKDHRLHYFDNNHLNQSGALLLVDAFRRALPEPFLLAGATQSLDRT